MENSRGIRVNINVTTDITPNTDKFIVQIANELYADITAAQKQSAIGGIEPDQIAVKFVSELENVLTIENLTRIDKDKDQLKKMIEESGITEGIEAKHPEIILRGTTLDELLSQYDPVTQEFTLTAPYTETGKAVREGASNVAEILKKEIEEAKILGPSLTTNISPAIKFTTMFERPGLTTTDNPVIIVQISREAIDPAIPIDLEAAGIRERKLQFPEISRRIYDLTPEARYNPARFMDNPNIRVKEFIEENLGEDIETKSREMFKREEDIHDFVNDVEFISEGGTFTESRPATSPTLAFTDIGQTFHESEITTVLPIQARADQVVIHVLPAFQHEFEQAKRKIEGIAPGVTVMEGVIPKTYAIHQKEYIEKITGVPLVEQVGEVKYIDALQELRKFRVPRDEQIEANLEMATRTEMKSLGKDTGDFLKQIPDMIGVISRNIVIDLGVIDVQDNQKITRFVQNIANRYIKDYMLTLFEQTI